MSVAGDISKNVFQKNSDPDSDYETPSKNVTELDKSKTESENKSNTNSGNDIDDDISSSSTEVLDFNFFPPMVMVTGFGPFTDHPVNASWEAVQRMNAEHMEAKHNIELVVQELSVTYADVDQFVPDLWKAYTPKLMLHVGVSSQAREITLETQAYKNGYQRKDYCDRFPHNNSCPGEGARVLQTQFDVDRICREFNQTSGVDVKAVTSKDAGRYLCEYIYYTSLVLDRSRTLFVHVPVEAVCPSSVTAKALELILGLCLEQLDENEQKSKSAKKGRV